MTRTIYKYPVKFEGVIVEAVDQKVVLVGVDPKINEVCVWVEHVFPKLNTGPLRRVQYLIQGTGFTMEDDESFHVGSVITVEGYVWHVYAKALDYRTKTGKILTDDDIQALADEAEAGYDVSHLMGETAEEGYNREGPYQ